MTTYLFSLALKNPESSPVSKIDLKDLKSPIFLVGTFSIDKTFFTPNSDILSLGLSKYRHMDFLVQ